MKWAEANTRLSFVTATLNSLWAATPPSFQQHHVDGRARQVRRGAGVQRVGLVAELPVQRGGRVPTRHGPDAARGEHGASAALYGDRKSTRLNSSHLVISYAVFCLKKKKKKKGTKSHKAKRTITEDPHVM